jgi:hypothetical protein
MIADSKLSEAEFYSLAEPFKMDLIAYFSSLEDDMMEIISRGAKEGWTPEKIISEIDGLLGEK